MLLFITFSLYLQIRLKSLHKHIYKVRKYHVQRRTGTTHKGSIDRWCAD